jgi:hypothetical protein
MSREWRHVEISFTVNDPERLPSKGGEPMYADDVAEELRDVVQAAVDAWYRARGHELLSSKPLI